MTNSKPKVYPAEFKESVVKLAIESKRPVAQTAKELGITRNTLYTWVDKYSKPKELIMRTDEHLYDDYNGLKNQHKKKINLFPILHLLSNNLHVVLHIIKIDIHRFFITNS